MYQPADGNYEHWALYLQNLPKHTIYEVLGHPLDFKTNVLLKEPSATKRHKRSIFLYDLCTDDIPAFEHVLSTVKPVNSTRTWNCQYYVLDVLEALEEKGVIDKEDEAYIEGKNQAKKYFGPTLSTAS